MTSAIKFSPLWGANGSENEPICFLLQIDEFNILLDCGWESINWDVSLLEPLKNIVSSIDAVLVSHSDIGHIGALPYAVGKLGLKAPIYATIPVYKMGQMFMYDAYQSRHNQEDFTLFTLDDVDLAFDLFVQLKYSQHVTLGTGIEITPIAAGHSIGGTIWRIRKETDEIIYAVDYNHKKERHLNAGLIETLSRPTLLITDALNGLYTNPTNKKAKENEMMQIIHDALKNEGNILIPVDTSGRSLELLLFLDQIWTAQKISAPLVFLTNVSFNTIEFAKSQLEWMSDSVMKVFDYSRENPFLLKNVKLLGADLHDLEIVQQLPSPKIVLASFSDLESGFARNIFAAFAENPKNSIIFVERPKVGSVAEKVLKKQSPIQLEINYRILLEGRELDEFKKLKKEQIIKENQMKLDRVLEDQSDSDFEDEEPTKQPFQKSSDMTLNQFYQQGFKHAMFPFTEKHSLFDEYGEQISPNDFVWDNSKPTQEDKKKEEVPPPQEEIPTKLVTSVKTIYINANVRSIDFEGRSDARSIKSILQRIAPRKMILVHGSTEAVDAIKKFAETSLKNICKQVLAPLKGEKVLVTSDTNIFKVKLKDTLVDNLKFFNVDKYEVAWVNGKVSNNSKDETPILEELPSMDAPGHSSVFIGDPKLSDFKQVLLNAGYHAELYGGVLWTCEGMIALKKEEVDGQPRIKLDGVLCDDYFKIRDLLYSQYTIL